MNIRTVQEKVFKFFKGERIKLINFYDKYGVLWVFLIGFFTAEIALIITRQVDFLGNHGYISSLIASFSVVFIYVIVSPHVLYPMRLMERCLKSLGLLIKTLILIFFGLFLLFYFGSDYPPSPFIDFYNNNDFITAFIVSALFAFYSTRTPQKILYRLRNDLSDISDIISNATKMMKDIQNDRNSVLLMMFSSPVLGIDKNKGNPNEFYDILIPRLCDSSMKTRIASLTGRELMEFLARVASYPQGLGVKKMLEKKRKGESDSIKIYNLLKQMNSTVKNALEAIDIANKSDSHLGVFKPLDDWPPYNLMITRDGELNKKALFFFGDQKAIEKGYKVGGFVTEDLTLIKHFEETLLQVFIGDPEDINDLYNKF